MALSVMLITSDPGITKSLRRNIEGRTSKSRGSEWSKTGTVFYRAGTDTEA